MRMVECKIFVDPHTYFPFSVDADHFFVDLKETYFFIAVFESPTTFSQKEQSLRKAEQRNLI